MALEKCPECSNEVSSTANSCPKCGFNLFKERAKKKSAKGAKGCAIGCFSLLGLIVLISIITSGSSSDSTNNSSFSLGEVVSVNPCYALTDKIFSNEMSKYINAKDQVGLNQMIELGKVIVIDYNTTGKIIGHSGIGAYEIRIVSGTNTGTACIVPYEFIKKVSNGNLHPTGSVNKAKTTNNKSSKSHNKIINDGLMARIDSISIIPFVNNRGEKHQLMLFHWTNIGTKPIGTIWANIAAYDKNNVLIYSANNECIFTVPSSGKISPGTSFKATQDNGSEIVLPGIINGNTDLGIWQNKPNATRGKATIIKIEENGL